MKAPDNCNGCLRTTSANTCLKGKRFDIAWICRQMGWHETPAQVRERAIREQQEHIPGLLREAQAQYTAEQVAQRALMTGVRR